MHHASRVNVRVSVGSAHPHSQVSSSHLDARLLLWAPALFSPATCAFICAGRSNPPHGALILLAIVFSLFPFRLFLRSGCCRLTFSPWKDNLIVRISCLLLPLRTVTREKSKERKMQT